METIRVRLATPLENRESNLFYPADRVAGIGPTMRVAILPFCRSTFDTELASEKRDAAIAALEGAGCQVVGIRSFLVDGGNDGQGHESA